MNYQLMETPFKLVPFHSMSHKQAEQYFQWFITEKDKRIQQLEKFIKCDDESINLDYSEESLLKVWKWFEPKIMFENKTDEELEIEIAKRPEKFKTSIPHSPQKITTFTLALAMDISIYWGETLVVNNPTIYWGYKTSSKTLDGINRPVLLGFRYAGCVFPYTLIQVLIRKSAKEKNGSRLFELYSKWIKNV